MRWRHASVRSTIDRAKWVADEGDPILSIGSKPVPASNIPVPSSGVTRSGNLLPSRRFAQSESFNTRHVARSYLHRISISF
ncbi:hypothetical protein RB6525 [Rhodopirellula baltica SH 1]|uniref:Uncharacterized protein n=1 Tax=Rhodopirellula baltica (strain DSM 10527 / NCIMB 13988 / SH1) TaxID=243090 RepID=Q7UQ45_RHOBA|nr:hypothetical protein RB6525 [Rhodopirellula baltica SH 1]